MSSQVFDLEGFHFLSKLGASTGPSLELILGLSLFVFVFAFWLAPGGLAWALSKTRTTIPGPSGWPILGMVLAFTASLTHRGLAKASELLKAKPLMAFSLGFTRSLKIKSMMSMGGIKSLFLVAKATILLFLVLAASATPVDATRPSNLMKPKLGASGMYFPQGDRPIQPSAPNPCSYLPGPGHCKHSK